MSEVERAMNCLRVAFDEDWFVPKAIWRNARKPTPFERDQIFLEALREVGIERHPSDEAVEALAVAVGEAAERWLKANVIH